MDKLTYHIIMQPLGYDRVSHSALDILIDGQVQIREQLHLANQNQVVILGKVFKQYAGCFQSGKRKSRLEGMRAAILEQNRQQGIASPRAEHKAKLLALGIEQTDEAKAQRLQRTPACLTCESVQRPSQNRLFLGVVRVSA